MAFSAGFSGCQAVACIRKLPKDAKRTSANYTIEETCLHAQDGSCTYKKPFRKYDKEREANNATHEIRPRSNVVNEEAIRQ